MLKSKINKYRSYLKLALWVLLIQIILVNISAAIYAHRFTHFYEGPPPPHRSGNIFEKTWKLFTGPRFYRDTNEALPIFPIENVSFKTTDGITIDAWYSSQDSARGCVILFHGITANKAFLNAEAAMFRSWNYNVLLVDFRAHGKSGGDNSSYGIKETAEVQSAFEYAKSRGNTDIILYGVSLGSGVCIKAISEGLVQPTALIAEMPFCTLQQHFRARAREMGFPGEPFGSLVTLWTGAENGFNGFTHDVSKYAVNVKCPVLVEWGEDDRLISRKETEKVYANLGSEYKKLITYPGVGHESFLRHDPLKWSREVQGFLDERGK